MFETAGSLAIVQPALLLVWLVLLPFLGSLVAALFARTRPDLGRAASVACGLGALALAIVLVVRLALLPHGTLFVQRVAQLARLGQLDLAFDLTLDPRSAVFALVVALVGVASAVQTTWSARMDRVARLAWSGLLTSGAMLVSLGDGFAPLLVGLGGLSLGAWGLSRGARAMPTVVATAGNVAVMLGLVFLFWSLGGAFGPDGYDPDGAPRFVLVTTGTPSGDPEKATLSMTTHAGALVSSDDADLPGEPVVAPFSIAVSPAIHTLRIRTGTASADIVVPRVALVAGKTHVLTPYGPTTSLRALEDQLAVPRLAPTGRPATVRAALTGRTIGAFFRASAVILLMLFGGALAHLHAVAGRRGPSALASVLEALPAPFLAVRLAPLVDPTTGDGALVLVLGAGSALVLAARAASAQDGHQALRGVLGATASAAVAAAGVGESSAAIVLAASALVSTSGALAALDARRDPRWLGLACAGIVGVLPGAGTSPGYFLAFGAALAAAGKASGGWTVLPVVIGCALVTACALGALAVFRVYNAIVFTARAPAANGQVSWVPSAGQSRMQIAVSSTLALVGLVVGVVLGVGTTMFGGRGMHLAARLTGSGSVVTSRGVALVAVVVSLAAAALGVGLARRVSASSVAPGWLLALGRPYAFVARAATAVGRGAWFLHRSVHAMDRDVVDDVPAAILGAVMGVARLTRIARATERGADAAAAELETPDVDGTRMAERIRTAALLVMVALLGLVVLSSLLLG